MKFFDTVLPLLEAKLRQVQESQHGLLPSDWSVGKHDRALLRHVADKGLSMEELAAWASSNVENAQPTAAMLVERLR